MIVSGLKGTQGALGKQIIKDFTGDRNFLYWFLAIGLIGSVGYVESLRSISRTFLVLIIVSMILKNGGVFAKLQEAMTKGPLSPPKPAAQASTGTGATSASSTGGDVLKLADFAAKAVALFA